MVPGSAPAADLDPHDADRLELPRAFDPADVDRLGPAEVGYDVADRPLGVIVVSGDQHRGPAVAEARVDEVGVADRVERLDHPGVGQRALDAFTERVLAADRE